MTLDWSKNSSGNDHGSLFQESDRKRMRSDQIDYDYFKKNQDEDGLAAMEIGFVRKLSDVVPRLELLGFTLDRVKQDYLKAVALCREERLASIADGYRRSTRLMSFKTF